ncbi:hypothetical protein BT69DRAFT_1329979 [Atractiella rhizophila]|nr:hypothetical protein BT69DRAFT_1329979 [Atractiella rhizophila]
MEAERYEKRGPSRSSPRPCIHHRPLPLQPRPASARLDPPSEAPPRCTSLNTSIRPIPLPITLATPLTSLAPASLSPHTPPTSIILRSSTTTNLSVLRNERQVELEVGSRL